ncbi:hypothetical protein QQ045_006789 [Rhodiola kirilowii]
MASQNKRPLIDAETESIGNKKRKNNPGGGGNNEFVAPADFTDDLVEIVFSYLPVLSAARMSLVSSRFRHSWKHCKNMVFDKTLVCGIGHLKVMWTVDMAMKWHVGPKIDKFSIRINNCGMKSLLDEWIRIAVRKNVEEIELDYSPTQVSQSVPVGVFEAHFVRTLKLINVNLEKPRRMQQQWVRMTLLKDLRLRYCELKFFKAVFSRCLLLEYLEIFKCRSVGVLWLSASKHRNFRTLKVLWCVDLEEIRMHAPTLKTFYYQGNMRKIVMKGRMPHLNGACVHYIPAMSIMPENLFTKLIIGSANSLTALSLNRVFIEVFRMRIYLCSLTNCKRTWIAILAYRFPSVSGNVSLVSTRTSWRNRNGFSKSYRVRNLHGNVYQSNY